MNTSQLFELEELIEMVFLDLDSFQEYYLNGDDRARLFNSLGIIMKIIFEPDTILRNRKKILAIKGDYFNLLFPDKFTELGYSTQELWKFMNDYDLMKFLFFTNVEWLDENGYLDMYRHLYPTIRNNSRKLSMEKSDEEEFAQLLNKLFTELHVTDYESFVEDEQIQVVAGLKTTLEFIFEPQRFLGEKYLKFVREGTFDLFLPGSESALESLVRNLWSFIKSFGLLNFIDQMIDWENYRKYIGNYENFRKNLSNEQTKILSNPTGYRDVYILNEINGNRPFKIHGTFSKN